MTHKEMHKHIENFGLAICTIAISEEIHFKPDKLADYLHNAIITKLPCDINEYPDIHWDQVNEELFLEFMKEWANIVIEKDKWPNKAADSLRRISQSPEASEAMTNVNNHFKQILEQERAKLI